VDIAARGERRCDRTHLFGGGLMTSSMRIGMIAALLFRLVACATGKGSR